VQQKTLKLIYPASTGNALPLSHNVTHPTIDLQVVLNSDEKKNKIRLHYLDRCDYVNVTLYVSKPVRITSHLYTEHNQRYL